MRSPFPCGQFRVFQSPPEALGTARSLPVLAGGGNAALSVLPAENRGAPVDEGGLQFWLQPACHCRLYQKRPVLGEWARRRTFHVRPPVGPTYSAVYEIFDLCTVLKRQAGILNAGKRKSPKAHPIESAAFGAFLSANDVRLKQKWVLLVGGISDDDFKPNRAVVLSGGAIPEKRILI